MKWVFSKQFFLNNLSFPIIVTQLLYRPISLEAVDVVDETEEADYLIEDGL